MTAVPYARRQFPGGAVFTTVPNGIGQFDATCTLFSGDNWPSSAGGDFYVGVDYNQPTFEKILCSGTSGLVLTFAAGGRGADGTTAVEHAADCQIFICSVGQDDDEANQVVSLLGNAASGSLFVGGGTSTLPSVLPVGSTGRVLTVVGGTPAWAGVGSPSMNAASIEASFTAAGQLYTGTGSGSGEQLAKGSAGQILTVGGADASGLEWSAIPAWLTPTAETSTYSANPGDFVQANASGGAFAVTIPVAVGGAFVVMKMDSTEANGVTITPASGTIAGQASLVINDQYAGYMLLADGTNINVIAAFGAETSGSNVVAVSTTYTAKANDFVQATATSAAFTVTVPVAKGAITTVKKMDSTFAHAVTISPASGHIDGNTSLLLYGQYAGYVFCGDGTNANVVGVLESNWQSYTPSWLSTGTAPAIGNGSVQGSFQQIGRRIEVQIYFAAGSTTTFGTGHYIFTAPVTSQTGLQWFGNGQIQDTSLYNFQSTITGGGTSILMYGPASSTSTVAALVTPTVPVTWTTNNQTYLSLDYQI